MAARARGASVVQDLPLWLLLALLRSVLVVRRLVAVVHEAWVGAMTPIWRPLGAQLIPILVREPYVQNDLVMCFRWFPGVLFCGITAWRRITGR